MYVILILEFSQTNSIFFLKKKKIEKNVGWASHSSEYNLDGKWCNNYLPNYLSSEQLR